jgi:O-methyltransferase involved in polyketide biosynthesis
MDKDFTSVSPSAWPLLLMKAETNIPYAKEAAQLLTAPENILQLSKEKNIMYWARVLHFEERYQSISMLLNEIKPNNILELSSGFSFRGLDMTENNNNLHYIDTDLPGIVEAKKAVIEKLRRQSNNQKERYELLPLNVLDKQAFEHIVNRFRAGAITIVNEGLLMYLNRQEKETLCQYIYETLRVRGGHWITADIYYRYQMEETRQAGDSFDEFLDRHHARENMFIDDQDARQFFESMGFVIERIPEPEYQTMSAFPRFMQFMTEEQMAGMNKVPKLRETWQLSIA